MLAHLKINIGGFFQTYFTCGELRIRSGPKVNVNFFTADQYTLGNRIQQTFQVHPCLDYTLMDYSHSDYHRLDYKAIWTIPNWTTYI